MLRSLLLLLAAPLPLAGCADPPAAAFTAEPSAGVAPLRVTFTNRSAGEARSWRWDFGDGGSSQEESPTHSYASPGSYAVTLEASGPGGSTTHEAFVVVRDQTLAAAPAPGSLASSLSQFGITWTFAEERETGTFVNGDRWVVGPVTIVGIDPPSRRIGNRTMNGAMLDPSPRTDVMQGYDTILYGQYDRGFYQPELNVALDVSPERPLVLEPHHSLVSTVSLEQDERWILRSAAILTVLPAAAPPDAFRPAYSVPNKTPRFSEKQLDYGVLRELDLVSGTPLLAEIERRFERPWLDHVPGWMGESIHPQENMPGYGRDIAAMVGDAALMLHLDFTPEQKRTLLIRYVQLGIDLFGIVQTGGQANWTPNGGHASGRKWPILFAGIVLGDAQMSAIGRDERTLFGEDAQTFYVEETAQGEFNHGFGGYTADDVGLAEWGIRHATQPELDRAGWDAPYRDCCSANAWIGFVLAARLMGARELWNHDALFDYVDRYVDESRRRAATDWKASWSPFALAMWDAYRSKE